MNASAAPPLPTTNNSDSRLNVMVLGVADQNTQRTPRPNVYALPIGGYLIHSSSPFFGERGASRLALKDPVQAPPDHIQSGYTHRFAVPSLMNRCCACAALCADTTTSTGVGSTTPTKRQFCEFIYHLSLRCTFRCELSQSKVYEALQVFMRQLFDLTRDTNCHRGVIRQTGLLSVGHQAKYKDGGIPLLPLRQPPAGLSRPHPARGGYVDGAWAS